MRLSVAELRGVIKGDTGCSASGLVDTELMVTHAATASLAALARTAAGI